MSTYKLTPEPTSEGAYSILVNGLIAMPAAQPVFDIPELMSLILEHFVGERRHVSQGNPSDFGGLKSLQQSSLVNENS